MVTQTLALLLDSYRELNSKKMFWISLVLSGVVVVAFSMIGIEKGSLYFLWFKTPIHFDILSMIEPATFYKVLFVSLGIRYWLTFLAAVLALISTAGIFPDLIANGSIDLYLSKPLSRSRLFAVKYVGGLLFAAMQVAIFTVGCFFLLGFRSHSWEPGVFLAIPVVVLIYSYLFCVCVLLGVVTRSTIASLLLTLLLWLGLWGIKITEEITQVLMVRNDLHVAILERQIPLAQKRLEKLPASTRPAAAEPETDDAPEDGRSRPFFSFLSGKPESREHLERRITTMQTDLADSRDSSLRLIHGCVFALMTPLPKTDGTTDLLERYLIKSANLPDEKPRPGDESDGESRMNRRGQYEPTPQAMSREIDAQKTKRTTAWTIGTSVAFEAVICVWAAWLFCRRDY